MRLGTSSLVVAAFVGPGTVLTCASAGLRYGYALGWVLVFAVASVFILQSLTAGTGILARKGLGEALREVGATPLRRVLVYGLVVLGLWVGCAAFETGNLVGAAAGLELVLGVRGRWLVGSVAVLAALLLLLDLRVIMRVLTALVAVMGGLFVAVLFLVPLDVRALRAGLLVPRVPPGGLVTVIALLGTTVVTYNLFLHASATKGYWKDEVPDRAWRRELLGMAVFLPIGGLISLAILAAGAVLHGEGTAGVTVPELARLLEPVAGSAARYLFGTGLLAAGLTSAVTAPLAAARGISELFGWQPGRPASRLVWASVIGTGLAFGLTGLSPLRLIVAAQAANGLLLPLVAAFVLYLTYRQRLVALPRWYLVAGAVVLMICAVLGGRTLLWVWSQL